MTADAAPTDESGVALAAEVRGTRAGLLVLGGIAALNLGNAAFHLLSARLLGPAQYGDVVSLVAAQGLIALPFGGIQYAVARFVARDAARGDAEAVASFAKRAFVGTSILAGVVTIALTVAAPLLQSVLDVQKLIPVILTAFYMLPAILIPWFAGMAQGMQRFGLISISFAAGAASRLALIVLLIPFGLGEGGVMGATFVAGFAAIVPLLPFALPWLRRPARSDRGPTNREVLTYAGPVMFGTLAITSLTTIDVIVAKLALSSHLAGIYGSASFIGRLLLYLPTTVATVLLPKVTSRAAVESDTQEILYASLAVTAIFSLAGTVLLALFPEALIHVTFGAKYDAAAPLLWIFGLAMTGYALLNVLLAYNLGHGRKGMAWLLLGGAVLQIGVFAFAHSSPRVIIAASACSALVLLVVHEVGIERTLPDAAWWLVRRVRRAL
jgi:O-antigen/teichoic acid export membrane protein